MAEQTRVQVIAAVGEELEGPLIELCERVAIRAGVSAATVRKLFPRREALLAAGLDHVINGARPPDAAALSTVDDAVDVVFGYFDDLGPERLWAAYRHADESAALRERVRRIERAVEPVIKRHSGGDRSAAAFMRALLDPLAYRRLRMTGLSGKTARAQIATAISAVVSADDD